MITSRPSDAAAGHDVDVLVGSDGKISEAHALGFRVLSLGTANLITKVVVDLEALAEEAAALGRRD